MFTEYQSLYFAHWLTLAGRSERQLSVKMGSAKVDMNPHQIEAALFALKSPIEKGVLLADEVGLGKTIEAGLVMAQRWAEKKYKILLIVPASLRKQWAQELEDKFELTSLILDSEVAKSEIKAGRNNPFDQNERIVICSYEFASRRKELLQDIRWELVVFDEAHKLRNLYKKDGNITAKNIHQATLHAESKILLSATPIQNNLMELYGLAKVIDEHFFGDEQSFKVLYAGAKKSQALLKDLSKRIEPICHRTLRRQVQKEGGISFTNRFSLTQDFTPFDDEWELYEKLSTYLSNDNLHAMQPSARHLVTIGMRKILASSSFAILDTLKKMIDRLESHITLSERDLSDLENADEWLDRFDTQSDDTEIDLDLAKEISELKDIKSLAARINRNAKGEALMAVLGKAFNMVEKLGGSRKAVIFTESCRTQRYIRDHLESHGYKGRTVLLNGSNNDEHSKEIYRAWKEKHQGSARITGSKTADMKAAIVDYFAGDAEILISTEAGSEGINLQFCSLLINYDLPWNPQKVEQRIGRIHRYGQKNDVVIVNFVNRKNRADNRVFELLNDKFKLFEGVFGASDEILGAIVSGDIDIEKRIYEIYQKCRSNEQIEFEFDRLNSDVQQALEVRERAAIQTMMNKLDINVLRKLKHRRENSNLFLDGYQQMLLNFARAELPDADFHDKYFFYNGVRYDLIWEQSQKNDSEFFRLQAVEHKLAWQLIHKAKARSPSTVLRDGTQIAFRYGATESQGQYFALRDYVNQSGIISVNKLTFNYAGIVEEHLLVAAKTDNGKVLDEEDAMRLLEVPAEKQNADIHVSPRDLDPIFEKLAIDRKIETQKKLEQYFEQESTKLERWADDRRRALEMEVKELDREIREQKKAARQLASLQEKIDFKRAIKLKEAERDKAMASYQEAKKKIEQQEDALLDEIQSKLELDQSTEPLFHARWTLLP